MSLSVDKVEIHEASFFLRTERLIAAGRTRLTTILGLNILTEVTSVRVKYLE